MHPFCCQLGSEVLFHRSCFIISNSQKAGECPVLDNESLTLGLPSVLRTIGAISGGA